MKLSDFVKQSTVPAKLIRAVVRQVGCWEDFQQIAKDVVNLGGYGYKGFIYYDDTVAFTKRNKRAILEFAADQDSEIESVGLVKFVAGFGCLDETEDDEVARALYAGRGDAVTGIYNALAWYMLDEVCYSYVDLLD